MLEELRWRHVSGVRGIKRCEEPLALSRRHEHSAGDEPFNVDFGGLVLPKDRAGTIMLKAVASREVGHSNGNPEEHHHLYRRIEELRVGKEPHLELW